MEKLESWSNGKQKRKNKVIEIQAVWCAVLQYSIIPSLHYPFNPALHSSGSIIAPGLQYPIIPIVLRRFYEQASQ
jgi:hypothetical protein